jgi:hypothetical protein
MDFLQYADDIVLYSSYHLLQTACTYWFERPAQRFFFAAWTHDILYKVEGGIVLSEALAVSGLVVCCLLIFEFLISEFLIFIDLEFALQ